MIKKRIKIRINQDKEGLYRPEFVARILKASREKNVGEFESIESFLSLL